MKKLLSIGVLTSLLATSCGKKQEKKVINNTQQETKKQEKEKQKQPKVVVSQGKFHKGKYKLGYVGSNYHTQFVKDVIRSYSQDIATEKIGSKFLDLKSGLSLLSSKEFNYFKDDVDNDYGGNSKKLTDALKTYIEINNKELMIVFSENNNQASIFRTNEVPITIVNRPLIDKVMRKVYRELKENTSPSPYQIVKILKKLGYKKYEQNYQVMKDEIQSLNLDENYKSYIQFSKDQESYNKDKIKKFLSDETKLAKRKIDTLFVYVKDDVENDDDVKEALVDKKQMPNTNVFMIDQYDDNSDQPSKKLVKGKISGAMYSPYLAAYIAGFQAAVNAITYDGSDDQFEETTVSFLIGSLKDKKAKKKAFAFYRGVKAAAAHPSYSKYLKVKIVSKSSDKDTSLVHDVDEWQEKVDGNDKRLYVLTQSNNFEGDHKIVYIAGTTAKDWRGHDGNLDNTKEEWGIDSSFGLIGSLYNYNGQPKGDIDDSKFSDKSFSSGIWLVLDNPVDYRYGHKDALAQSKTGAHLQRREIKLYGTIGNEALGVSNYVDFALQGLYMEGANYMINKYTHFGAQLDIFQGVFNPNDILKQAKFTHNKDKLKHTPWVSAGGDDSWEKAYERYVKSLNHAWALELKEADLVKESPWMK